MAADPTKATLEKITKLLAAGKELHSKAGEILDEIDALLGGKAGIGADLKVLEAAYDRAWCARYAPGQVGRFVWAYQRDRPHLKRLIKKLGVDETGARMLRYLASDEAFFVRTQHSFAAFVASVNQWADAKTAPPADCRHTPFCKSDQEHTRRRSAELRELEA